jgi:hypothetical protein
MKMSHSEAGRKGAASYAIVAAEAKLKRIDQYTEDPIRCGACSLALPYEKRGNKYCDSSCAATFNNRIRTVESRIAQIETLQKTLQTKTGITIKTNETSNSIPTAGLILKTTISIHCPFCKKINEKRRSNSRYLYCNAQCRLAHIALQKIEIIKANENSSCLRIKKYLLDSNGHICMDPQCAWDFNKRPLKVELEHIDGNAENNTLLNCVLLCPNCHSQTSTYKSRNKGNGRHKRRIRYTEGKSY